MSPMHVPPCRVALLTNFIPPYRLPLYKALHARLGELHIFLPTVMEPDRAWPTNWGGLNVSVQRTLTARGTWRHPQGFSCPLYIHIPYDTLLLLRRYRPDAVISGALGFHTLQALLYRKLHPETRLIVWATLSEHTEQGRGRLRERLRRWLLRQADGVLVNGKSGTRYVRQFGVPIERIFQVPYTTDVRRFGSTPLRRDPSQAYRLLYVGQLTERKGLLPFLSSLDRWAKLHPQREVQFWLVGDGPQRDELAHLCLSTNVQLHLLGNVAYPELPQVYAQGGILAFPSLADEWGVVVNEGMAAGLPVLGSLYSQAVEELVREGETGWLFRPDHAEELYAALDRALGTPPSLLEKMRFRAREIAAAITPEAMADRILRAIHWCLQ